MLFQTGEKSKAEKAVYKMRVVGRTGTGAYIGAGVYVETGEWLPQVPHLAPLTFYLYLKLIFKLWGQFV